VESSGCGITLEEEKIPVDESVQSVCEILGMDPLMMANEGKMVVVVPAEKAEKCLEAVRKVSGNERGSIIGTVQGVKARLTLRTPYGTTRVVTMPMGNQLPRIC
jgi:hydrogenase expression/formation protein HypE